MILIGEIKKFESARNGHKMVINHLPDFPLMLHDKLYGRLQTRYESEFALSDTDEASHLLAIATFGLTTAGLAIVEEMVVMVANENWVPYETAYEKKLIDALSVAELDTDELRHLAAKALLPEKLVVDTAAETVQRFRQVWQAEKEHLPLAASVVKAIDGHAPTVPLFNELP